MGEGLAPHFPTGNISTVQNLGEGDPPATTPLTRNCKLNFLCAVV